MKLKLQIKGESCSRLPRYKIGNINYPALGQSLDNRSEKSAFIGWRNNPVLLKLATIILTLNMIFTFDNTIDILI